MYTVLLSSAANIRKKDVAGTFIVTRKIAALRVAAFGFNGGGVQPYRTKTVWKLGLFLFIGDLNLWLTLSYIVTPILEDQKNYEIFK